MAQESVLKNKGMLRPYQKEDKFSRVDAMVSVIMRMTFDSRFDVFKAKKVDYDNAIILEKE